jgi:6-phosphogluconolactonase
MTKPEVRVVENIALAAAELFIEQAERAVRERQQFAVALSGGSTPLAMYKLLIEDSTSATFWPFTHVFWGDERYVPHDHPDSNFGVAKGALLEHVPIPDSHIHPVPYLPDDSSAAARSYADTLNQVLGNSPVLDVTLLGLGDDAHTASLFPGTGAVHDDGLVTVVDTETKGTRISLTSSMLSSSRTVAFLVSGEKKRSALVETLAGHDDLDRYPARAITAQEQLVWLTDIQL